MTRKVGGGCEAVLGAGSCHTSTAFVCVLHCNACRIKGRVSWRIHAHTACRPQVGVIVRRGMLRRAFAAWRALVDQRWWKTQARRAARAPLAPRPATLRFVPRAQRPRLPSPPASPALSLHTTLLLAAHPPLNRLRTSHALPQLGAREREVAALEAKIRGYEKRPVVVRFGGGSGKRVELQRLAPMRCGGRRKGGRKPHMGWLQWWAERPAV